MINEYVSAINFGKMLNALKTITKIPNPRMIPRKGIITRFDKKNNPGN